MSVILWLVIINVAVVAHELAHFLAARAQGVGVRAFSVGMGPILARREWRGTEWRLSALPIGGYVDIEGMAPTADADGRPLAAHHGWARLPYLGKMLVLAAGPIANLVLAIALAAAALAGQGRPVVRADRAEFQQVVPNSAASRAGFESGDVIVAIDGRALSSYEDVRAALLKDGSRSFTVLRDGARRDVRFTWAPGVDAAGERPKFGVYIAPVVRYEPVSVPAAVVTAASTLVGGIPATVAAFVRGFVDTFTFARSSEVAGPVGTVSVIGSVAQAGVWPLLSVAALINLSLSVFNLLPIPGLDGGRMLLATVAAIRRRPFKPGQEEFINFVGFAFVLVFIGLVTLTDLSRLGG